MIEVETLTLGFNHCAWSVDSLEQAEELARRKSIAESDNPCYPNPYLVVDNGRPVAQFYRGEKLKPAGA